MEQNKVFFQREVERLTELQLNLFGSRGKRHKHRFRQKRYYQEYRLGSSANVLGIKKALVKKDLIDVEGTVITFNDPIFKLWIKRYIPFIL